MYLQLIGICLLVDQLVINIFIQIFHSHLGVRLVFQIWWIWHLIIFILIHIIAPYIIINIANKEYPEFEGLTGRKYPGQEGPRSQVISPERSDLNYQNHLLMKASLRRYQKLKMKSHFYQVLPKIKEEVVDHVAIDIH